MMKLKSIISLMLFVSITLFGQDVDYNLKKGKIAQGYDVTSYFADAPEKGAAKYSSDYNGATLYFSSQANLDKFKTDPEKYMPQYGGWCAYAMGVKGEKVSIDPTTYEIRDGQLYLFYNSWGTNTLELWTNENPEELKVIADSKWEEIKLKK